MRAIPLPKFNAQKVHEACISGVKDSSLSSRLNAIELVFSSSAVDYVNRANSSMLYTIIPSEKKKGEVLVGAVTIDEVKSLYSYYMINKSMPARSFYNELVANAPNGICPLCGVGYAITLDHYLPKSKFPMFSILPENLIPACRDCNTGKSNKVPTTPGEQSLHPYYDRGKFINEQWLFAEIKKTVPPVVDFLVKAPSDWSRENQERVTSHFDSLSLGIRFSTLAANELASLKSLLIEFIAPLGIEEVKNHLRARAVSEEKIHKNSWKFAMFQALSENEWYCSEGIYG